MDSITWRPVRTRLGEKREQEVECDGTKQENIICADLLSSIKLFDETPHSTCGCVWPLLCNRESSCHSTEITKNKYKKGHKPRTRPLRRALAAAEAQTAQLLFYFHGPDLKFPQSFMRRLGLLIIGASKLVKTSMFELQTTKSQKSGLFCRCCGLLLTSCWITLCK